MINYQISNITERKYHSASMKLDRGIDIRYVYYPYVGLVDINNIYCVYVYWCDGIQGNVPLA